MLQRMAQHYTQLAAPKEHKYKILAEAARRGHTIRFSLMYCATAPASMMEEEIGAKEGELIRAYRPPLNYQIPTAANWRKFTTAQMTVPANSTAVTRNGSREENS